MCFPIVYTISTNDLQYFDFLLHSNSKRQKSLKKVSVQHMRYLSLYTINLTLIYKHVQDHNDLR